MRLSHLISSLRFSIRENAANPTSKEMADQILHGVGNLFGDMYFKVEARGEFGEDAISITLARMHRNEHDSSGVKFFNTRVFTMMVSSAGEKWSPGLPAPEKVKVKSLVGRKESTIRAKTDTPQKMVAYIVKWLRENKEKLIGGGISDSKDGSGAVQF